MLIPVPRAFVLVELPDWKALILPSPHARPIPSFMLNSSPAFSKKLPQPMFVTEVLKHKYTSSACKCILISGFFGHRCLYLIIACLFLKHSSFLAAGDAWNLDNNSTNQYFSSCLVCVARKVLFEVKTNLSLRLGSAATVCELEKDISTLCTSVSSSGK